MRQHGNRTRRPRTEFAREVTKLLIARDINNTVLWKGLLEREERITKVFLDMVCSGYREPPVRLINPICDVLGVSEDRRHALHRAAAVDRGYQLGVPLHG